MRPSYRHPLMFAAAVLVAGALTACAGESISAPAAPQPDALVAELAAGAPRLLECSVAPEEPVAALDADLNGGSLAVGKKRLRVPAGAVSGPVRLTMATPASANVELALHAVGYASYKFKKPVSVTIDYSRCDATTIAPDARLRVVYIDPVTRQVLQDMGGVVDTVTRTITFETDHFSSYAVAD